MATKRTTKSVFEEVDEDVMKQVPELRRTPEAALVLHLAGLLEASSPKEAPALAKALREARADFAVLIDKIKPVPDRLDEIKERREKRRARAHG